MGGVASLVGASVFPIGLIIILLAGGELVTGNVMAVSTAMYARKITVGDFLINLLEITLANFVGAVCVAYFFGHFVGLTHVGIFQSAVIMMAKGKIATPFWQSFVSGIGCNWLVGIAVWLSFGAKDGAGIVGGLYYLSFGAKKG
nr:formate/nitrite transporter family protein [Lactiplantibacillus mudanjiangensis]